MLGTSIAYDVTDKTAVLVHSTVESSPKEWADFMTAFRADVLAERATRLLVYSKGGAPTSVQREVLIRLANASKIPTVVVLEDDEVFIRVGKGRVCALDWIGSLQAQAFVPEKIGEALQKLGVEQGSSVQTLVDQLKKQVEALPVAKAS